MLWLASLALARDIDLKVHDMKGVVTGEVTVELGEPGKEPVTYTAQDDGTPPDGVAGDKLYTTRIEGLTLDHGSVTVRAGERVWQGGFRFETENDPVLLIGLEENGFAAASTKEVMFVPQEPMTPGGSPGAMPPGGAGMDAAAGTSRIAPTRTVLPDGMVLGWGLAALAVAGFGAIAWAGAGRPPRLPPLLGPARVTSAARGPFVAGDATDLYVGPGEGLAVADGRWRPEEIALAALRVRGPTRVVVTDGARVEAEGDAYAALTTALSGIADLLWVEQAPAPPEA